MPARKCFKCRSFYPATKGGPVKCACGETLQFSSGAIPNVPDDELAPLTPEIEQSVADGLYRLQAEARRRGPNWSPVDALEAWDDWAA